MKNRQFLSAFLGGVTGILLAGYGFYQTSQHYPILIPIGVFIGCAFGFTIGNSKLQKNVNEWWSKLKTSPARKLHFIELIVISVVGTLLLLPFIMVWLSTGSNHNLQFGFLCSFMCFFMAYFIASVEKMERKNRHKKSVALLRKHYNKYEEVGITKYFIMRSLLLIKHCLILSIILSIQILAVVIASPFIVLWMILSFIGPAIIWIIRDPIVFYLNALKTKEVLMVFVNTLIITALVYFIFRNLFSNEMAIWLVALASGFLSGFMVQLLPKNYHVRDYWFSNEEKFDTRETTIRLIHFIFSLFNKIIKKEIDRSNA